MPYTKKPKMIVFDVGGTLFHDGVCIPEDGFRGLLEHADNPAVTDAKTMADLWDRILDEFDMTNTSRNGYSIEIALPGILKYVAMQTGLKFSIPMAQQEEIFDRYNSTRFLTAGITDLLRNLDAMGVRTAVISNNMMSGEGLALSVARWIPEAKMEFCLTSADLLLAKPWGDLFTAAAKFAGVNPSDCWYCGDGRRPDVDGARNGGMVPVLYDIHGTLPAELRTDGGNGPYLAVNHWDALGNILKNL